MGEKTVLDDLLARLRDSTGGVNFSDGKLQIRMSPTLDREGQMHYLEAAGIQRVDLDSPNPIGEYAGQRIPIEIILQRQRTNTTLAGYKEEKYYCRIPVPTNARRRGSGCDSTRKRYPS
jgi:hypothetical protein